MLEGVDEAYASSARLKAWYDADVEANTRRRLETLLRHAHDSPDDPQYPFHIAKSYAVLGDLEQVQAWGERFLGSTDQGDRRALVHVWMVQATLAAGEFARAELLLTTAREAHPRFPDLEHLAVTLAVARWHQSLRRVEPRYLGLSQYTRSYARRLPDAAAALGLPLTFG